MKKGTNKIAFMIVLTIDYNHKWQYFTDPTWQRLSRQYFTGHPTWHIPIGKPT